MFVSAGSMLQLVVALTFSIAFGVLSAWFQPYGAGHGGAHIVVGSGSMAAEILTNVCGAANGAANIFKVGTEVTILLTLTLAVLLRFDLRRVAHCCLESYSFCLSVVILSPRVPD